MCSKKFDEVSQDNAREKDRNSGYCPRNTVIHRETRTVGDYARFHPHLHALVADGLFLESGYFFVMPKVNLQPLTEPFRAHVLKMLKKEELIDDTFIKMILKWRHTSGFGVHNEVRIKPDDDTGIENLSQISDQRETSIHYPQRLLSEKAEI